MSIALSADSIDARMSLPPELLAQLEREKKRIDADLAALKPYFNQMSARGNAGQREAVEQLNYYVANGFYQIAYQTAEQLQFPVDAVEYLRRISEERQWEHLPVDAPKKSEDKPNFLDRLFQRK